MLNLLQDVLNEFNIETLRKVLPEVNKYRRLIFLLLFFAMDFKYLSNGGRIINFRSKSINMWIHCPFDKISVIYYSDVILSISKSSI